MVDYLNFLLLLLIFCLISQNLIDENHNVAVPSMLPEAEYVGKLGKKKKKHRKSEIVLDNARKIGFSQDTGDHDHVTDKKKRFVLV